MIWFFASIIIVAQSRNLLAFECSSNAQVPYDGDRIIQASAAYTCSWVITVPENYTVKLTISKNNVASVGNTNCVNDYVQIRDGGSNTSTLLKKMCSSNPGPSVFRSIGSQMWVEYSSTHASNSFQASFKKLLDPSFCPGNINSNGTSGSITSPFYPLNYPSDMECTWNLTGPAGSRLTLVFYRICLGICPPSASSSTPCADGLCSSLDIGEVTVGDQHLCPFSSVTPFISVDNQISLSMLTNEQTSRGFVADYHTVFRDEACLQMTQLTNTSGWFSSPNFPANYPDNIQCGWNISIPAGYKIYLNFLDFDLEDCVSSCSCDYVEVAIGKDYAQKKCGTLQPGEWKVKSHFGRDIVVTFKSDSHSNKKGFQAVYTFVPLEAWESVPSVYCPWSESSTTTTPTTAKDSEEQSSQTAKTDISSTAEELSSNGGTDPPTLHTPRNSIGKTQVNSFLWFLTNLALVVFSSCLE